ncbi:hypothetical protein [Actinokineospora bangkokensis]|uniref:Uncharacterized protein n=1 Tax=Actinokineospora bangkokensis TaxID=1193682 RepID=A0A1Q9LIE8_9PSEU|nr:hypothetical protein [Actinokineospora bangkokensis]OLR91822.1 hypothetical protein BJP25_23565 [Actinokineospora bangkokensis]
MTEKTDVTGEVGAVPEQLRAATASVRALAEEVAAGRVLLDPEAGDRLRRALREQHDDAAGWLARARSLNRPVPLGGHEVGWAMGRKFGGTADGADGSMAGVLTDYLAVVSAALVAVDAAIRAFQDSDEGAARAFRRISGEGTW